MFFILVDQDPVPLQILSPDVKVRNAAFQVPELNDNEESTMILTITPSDLTSSPASDPLITSILIIDSDLFFLMF